MTRYDAENGDDWNQISQITGWFSQKEAIAMQRSVKQLPSAARIVELGVFAGRSSIVIAGTLPPDSTLYCVDHFKGSAEHQGHDFELNDLLASFKSNIEKYHVNDKIRILVMDTLQAAKGFATESVDLLFVDASHDYESVRADLLCWYPKLKVGGLLLCHDYTAWWPGVIEAIQSLQLEGEVIADSLWLHHKARSIEEYSKRSEQAPKVIEPQRPETADQMIGAILTISDQINELTREMRSVKDRLIDIQNIQHDLHDEQQIKGEDTLISMKKRKKKRRGFF